MRHLKAPPADPALFDLEACAWWNTQLTPSALRALREGWPGVFERTVLALMARPAEALGAHFDELLGRPTKERYALAGLMAHRRVQKPHHRRSGRGVGPRCGRAIRPRPAARPPVSLPAPAG